MAFHGLSMVFGKTEGFTVGLVFLPKSKKEMI